MSDKRYPTRMHEVLGVEPEERFTYSEWEFWLSESGLLYRICDDDGTSILATQGRLVFFINNPERITRRPRLTEEAQEKEDHIIRLKRMRSQKDQRANGKHAHWFETPADHAKDRDALDAALEALTGKPRLTEEQVAQLKALDTLGYRWLTKDKWKGVSAFICKPFKGEHGGEWMRYDPMLVDDGYIVFNGYTQITDLVSWSDPAPLDIVQTLRDAGVEVNDA